MAMLKTNDSSAGHNQAASPILVYDYNPLAPSSANQSASSLDSSPTTTSLFASSTNTTTASGLSETNTAPSTTSIVFNGIPFHLQHTPAPSTTFIIVNGTPFHFQHTPAPSTTFIIVNGTPFHFQHTPAPSTTSTDANAGANANHFQPTTALPSSPLFGITNPIPASFPATTVSPSSSLFGVTNPTSASFAATTVSPSSSLFGVTNPSPASFPAITVSPSSSLFGVTNHSPASFPATTVSPSSSLSGVTNSTPASFPATTASPWSPFFGLTNHSLQSFPATTVSPSSSLFGVTNSTPALFSATTASPLSSLFGNVQSAPASSSIFASSIDNATTSTQAPSSTTPLFRSPAPKFGDGFLQFSDSANAFSTISPAPAPLLNHSTCTPVSNFSNFPASTQRLGTVPCAPSTMFGGQTTIAPLHVCPCCGHKSLWEQHSGSYLARYTRTPESGSIDARDFFVSISATPVYKDKSHEELRLEDYKLQCKAKNGQQKSVMQDAESAKFGQPLWALPVLLSSDAILQF